MSSGRTATLLLLLSAIGGSGSAAAAQCGSALLLEVQAPAVFDAVDLVAPSVARFWEAGAAGTNGSEVGCTTGCTMAAGPLCATGGECIALTGVSWLNAQCSTPGQLPLRTIFLLEQTTADSGGRWAAVNVSRNVADANTDLDAKAAAICGGCSSTLSPYLGGAARPTVTDSLAGGGTLTVTLTWPAPPAQAEALSDGPGLITGYGVHFRTDRGAPPDSTGDRTGWTFAPDTGADGLANGGYSTDMTATVELPVAELSENVSFAIGLSFDGTGDPSSDANTLSSSFLSDASEPLTVPTGCGHPNNLLLENQTVTDTQEIVACLTITAGNGFTVGATGFVTVRAGESVRLDNGFSVETGGRFAVVIDATLAQ